MSWIVKVGKQGKKIVKKLITPCLLYTSDAADEL